MEKPVSEYNEVLEKVNATTLKGTDSATMIAILFSTRLYTGMTKRDKTDDVVIIVEQDNKR